MFLERSEVEEPLANAQAPIEVRRAIPCIFVFLTTQITAKMQAPGLRLHSIWPRGKPGGPTQASRSIKLARARWLGPSLELANEDHCSCLRL